MPEKIVDKSSLGVRRLAAWLPVIGLILVGAFLRLHQLDQTPPGLYHDEAFYAIDAQHLLRYGHWLIFYTGNNGREPLHIYVLAGALFLFGDRTWAIRLMSAFSGILAIPLMYRLGRTLWREMGRRARWVGLLAAASLAVSYWHVDFSRIAFRAADLVTVSILAVWLLWRGAQFRSRRLFVLSGLALGLSQYTYLAARVLPVVVLGLAGAVLVLGWQFGRRPLRAALSQPLVRGSLIALAVSALAFLPLGAYFALHPDQFSERSAGLSVIGASAAVPPGGTAAPTLAGNILATVRMFIDHGDVNPRHNLPGRPAVDWVGQIGLLAGVIAALLQWRRPRSILLLLWLGIMLLPTTLSIEAPHFLRAIGALPPLCLLVAGGLTSLWRLIADARPRLAAIGWPALLIGVTLIGGTLTYRDYFLRWATQAATADAFDIGSYTLAQRALALSQTVDVLLPLRQYTEPAALFSLEPVFGRLTPIDSAAGIGRPTVLLAPGGSDLGNLVLLRRLPGQAAQALVLAPLDTARAAQLAQQPASGEVYDFLGRPLADEVPGVEKIVLNGAQPQPQRALDAVFDGTFSLTGADLRPSVPMPGGVLQLELYWKSLKWAPEDEVVFVQLQSPAGDNLAQLDSQPLRGTYATTLWLPGTFVTDPYTLTVPAGLLPGTYRVVAGMYRPGSIQRLGVSGTHDLAGNTVVAGNLTLPDPQFNAQAIANRLDVTGGDPARLKLVGYDLPMRVLAPGTNLNLVLYWQALSAIDLDYTVFVHVLDANGQLVAQTDAQPLGGRAPTSWWRPGDQFRDPRTVGLGADLPPGTYTVEAGLYDNASGQRMPLFDASGQQLADGRLGLGTILVQKP